MAEPQPQQQKPKPIAFDFRGDRGALILFPEDVAPLRGWTGPIQLYAQNHGRNILFLHRHKLLRPLYLEEESEPYIRACISVNVALARPPKVMILPFTVQIAWRKSSIG